MEVTTHGNFHYLSQFAQMSDHAESQNFCNNWCTLYNEKNIPFKFRETLDKWISEQVWTVENSDYLFNEFLKQVRTTCTYISDKELLDKLQTNQPDIFVRNMMICLDQERNYIAQLRGTAATDLNTPAHLIEELRRERAVVDNLLTTDLHDRLTVHTSSQLDDSVRRLEANVTRALDEVQQWKTKANYPARWPQFSETSSLDQCQEIFTLTYDVLTCYTDRLSTMSPYREKYHQFKQQLVDNCLVVETSPPQCVQLDGGQTKGLSVVIRCLLPRLRLVSPDVKCHLACFHGVLKDYHITNNKFSAERSNKKSEMQNQLRCKSFKLKFSDYSETLYFLKFEVELGKRIEVHSNPFTVYTHVPQICSRLHDILYYHAFTSLESACKVNQKMPTQVRWSELKQVLDWEFHSDRALLVTNVKAKHGCRQDDSKAAFGFTQLNFKCLATALNINNTSEEIVTYDAIFKNKVTGCKFTFWEWFVACFLTKRKLKHIYDDNLLYGFITKPDAEALLENKQTGTFLLRFSCKHLCRKTKSYKLGRLSPSMSPVPEYDLHGELMSSEHYEKEAEFSNVIPKFLVFHDIVLCRNEEMVEFDKAFSRFQHNTEEDDDYSSEYPSLTRVTLNTSTQPSTPASSVSTSSSQPATPQSMQPATPQSMQPATPMSANGSVEYDVRSNFLLLDDDPMLGGGGMEDPDWLNAEQAAELLRSLESQGPTQL